MIRATHFHQFTVDLGVARARAFIVPNVPVDEKDIFIRTQCANAGKPDAYNLIYSRWLACVRPEIRKGKPKLLTNNVQAFVAICGAKNHYNHIAIGSLMQLLEGTVITNLSQLTQFTVRYFDGIRPSCLIALFREVREDINNEQLNSFNIDAKDIIELLNHEDLASVVKVLKEYEEYNDRVR